MNEDKKQECIMYYWQKVVGDKFLEMDLNKLKYATKDGFETEPDNYKQKLVYNLLETIRNGDQNKFFFILLKSINNQKKISKNYGMHLRKIMMLCLTRYL